MNEEIPLRKNTLFSVYLGTTGAILLLFLAVWHSASILPRSKTIRQFFLAENNLLEVIALGFLAAALILSVYALVTAPKPRASAPWWWLFPLGIFLLICDETSFGKVYYDWYVTIKICGVKFDALHDMLVVIPHCLPQLGISKLVFCLGVLAFLSLVFVLAGRLFLRHKTALLLSLKTHSVWLYLTIAFILFWIGGGLEVLTEVDFLKIERASFLIFLEEVFEMLAEYTVFFAALAFLKQKQGS